MIPQDFVLTFKMSITAIAAPKFSLTTNLLQKSLENMMKFRLNICVKFVEKMLSLAQVSSFSRDVLATCELLFLAILILKD